MIDMVLKEWKELVSKRDATSHSNFLKSAKVDRRLVAILEDPGFNKLLRTQHGTPITWMVSPQWKITWLRHLLASPSGGVCDLLSQAKHPLLTPYVEHAAYCTDGATHVSVP